MDVAIIGSGYVGLVAGACFADVGNDVICVDRDAQKVALLERGQIPIYEPGLERLVERNHSDGRLRFTTDTPTAVRAAQVIFIAVGTPPDEDGSADLSHVLAVARAIGESLQEDGKIVVCKSTVPVGTADKVRRVLAEQSDHTVHVVSNPEFLKEGSAVKDFFSPDRVIIGADSERAARVVARLYAPFMRRSERVLVMDNRSAEMAKYASNSMLAAKISFMNEIANICDAVHADVSMVRRGMAMDERIGPHFIYPGVGYGGSCFPKDVRALARVASDHDLAPRLLDAIEAVNNAQKLRLVELARAFFRGELQGKTFAIWGLSFKPKTDDVREAPALRSIRALVEAGARVRVSDPVALENAQRELEDLGDAVLGFDSHYEALEGADALCVFTEWNEYRSPNFKRIAEALSHPVIFDGRNIYDPEELAELNFAYFGIGRSSSPRPA